MVWGCSGEASSPGASSGEGSASETVTSSPEGAGQTAPSPRVARREQEQGLERCGIVLESMESPEAAPSFSRVMRECGGMYSRRRCRDALGADTFSRDAVAEACRADYCDDLRPQPPFCSIDMPTDAEFLEHYARFSRMVLSRDLRRIMDDDGAEEIADLFADMIEAQSTRQ